MSFLKKVTELTRPYWARVFGGIVLGLIVSGIAAGIAWIVKPALDQILGEKKYEYLIYIPPGIIILFTVRGALHFCKQYLMKSAGMKLVRDVRNRLYHHILGLPVSYFSGESSGVIISRVLNDVEALNGLVSDVIGTVVTEIPTVIFLLGVAFYRRWDLTLIILILMPLIGLGTRKFGKSVKKKRKEAQRKISLVTHRIGEAVLGIRIIKVFNRERAMGEKFDHENHGYYREMLRVIRLKEFTKLLVDIVTGIGIAAALWYGIVLIKEGIISPGDLGSILAALYMVFSPIKKISEAYTSLQEARASIERIDTILDVKHEDKGKTVIREFRDSIRFEHVSFVYPGSSVPVLKGIDLEIRHGEILAVVGHSGVGKSTLVDLIPCFYRPTSGRIIMDGIDITELELTSLRELIGIVSQDIILFNDTIRENIAFGRPGAGQSEIIDAARLAFADQFIQELSDGYDSMIGERGLKLSGGQRQRIAIARAILKNPPVLILDEATSSLDSVSETMVQKALEKLMTGRTTIVIAHRLSTIRNADRIIILDRGEIVDSGSHSELMSRNDTYIKLYNAFAHA